VAFAAAALGGSGCTAINAAHGASRRPLPLADVDRDRMYSGWYLITTPPNVFEKGMVAPTTSILSGGSVR
jgi:hypothetical protein